MLLQIRSLRQGRRLGLADAHEIGFGQYGSGAIFGDEENFRRYRVARLLPANADRVRDAKRLILMARGPKPQGHEKCRLVRLVSRKFPHEYRDEPECTHEWHSGWVSEAVDLLLAEGK